MAIVTDNGLIPERYDLEEPDNRDQGTTWLRVAGCHGDYVEVNPGELMGNMIENCYNDDVLFLYNQFEQYLTFIAHDDIKDDTSTDHIVGFRNWLQNLIDYNQEEV